MQGRARGPAFCVVAVQERSLAMKRRAGSSRICADCVVAREGALPPFGCAEFPPGYLGPKETQFRRVSL
jgi:hypothetical protein